MLITICLMAATALSLQAQTQVIAHRGYWKTGGSAQNSITALQKAAEAKVYGSEFDVQLTADGKVVVNHDDNIGEYTIADTPYKTLKKLKLKNGEPLPTLKNYLKEGKKHPGIQLILEIKPHKTPQQEDQIARAVVKMVKAAGLEKQVEYISFSLHVCELLAELTPGSKIAYLKGNLSPEAVKEKKLTGIDYNYNVLYKHPEWIGEAHKLGLKVNVWTVDKDKDIKRLAEMGVEYITTNEPVRAASLVK